MLVLSRRKGERVHIGERIVLTVIESRNGQVRLGFEAPEEVAILREEVRSHPRQSPIPEVEARGKDESLKQEGRANVCR